MRPTVEAASTEDRERVWDSTAWEILCSLRVTSFFHKPLGNYVLHNCLTQLCLAQIKCTELWQHDSRPILPRTRQLVQFEEPIHRRGRCHRRSARCHGLGGGGIF